MEKINVGIIGCGNIANQHVYTLRKNKEINILGVCDNLESRARFFSEKYNIEYYTSDPEKLITDLDLDAVHVLTPSHTHAELTKLGLLNNCHVFVEKPLCNSYSEALELIELSNNSNAHVSINHSFLADPMYLKGKKLIENGKIGEISHINFMISDDFLERYNNGTYRKWVIDQPMGVFYDLLPHPIYLLQDLMGDLVVANISFINSDNNLFPLNLIIDFNSSSQITATLNLSLKIEPIQQNLHVYGDSGNVLIDYRNFYVILERSLKLPQPLPRIYSSISKSWQYFREVVKNYFGLLLGRVHPYKGFRNIINNFYVSLKNNEIPNPTISDGANLVKIMEDIETNFNKKIIKNNHSENNDLVNLRPNILVTGATGFLGKELLNRLVEDGFCVRIICRKSSDISCLPKDNIDIKYVDIRDIEKFDEIFNGIEIVLHCASALQGNWNDHYETSILGTQKLLDQCIKHDINKIVHISSMGILDYSNIKKGQIINEDSPLEKYPNKRGFYTKAKLLQEKLVNEYIEKTNLNITIIRPGIIVDSNNPSMMADIGFRIKGIIMHIGFKSRVLRVVSLNNLVDSIILSFKSEHTKGKTYNVLDSPIKTIDYIRSKIRFNGFVIRIPIIIFIVFFAIVDFLLSKLPGQDKRHLVYKLIGMTKSFNYDTALANQDLKK